MIKYCRMRIVQIVETVRFNSFSKLLHEILYIDREAVPVEMDLASLRPMQDLVRPCEAELVELQPEMINRRTLTYPIKSRYYKAERYLRAGYRGFALVQADIVQGDIWCAVSRNPKDGWTHPDESWLDIRCEKGETYTFDMFVNPEQRGANLAAALQNGALHELKKQGFTKAYGFFWADNIPALWVHRTLRWKELPRVKATRIILSKKIQSM